MGRESRHPLGQLGTRRQRTHRQGTRTGHLHPHAGPGRRLAQGRRRAETEMGRESAQRRRRLRRPPGRPQDARRPRRVNRAPKRNGMDKFIDGIELLAALFVGIVAADIFISVMLRYLFSYSIPDSYDFGKQLLGILIFWGIAATSYRGTHITVDLVWAASGPKGKRWIDVFATLVLLFVVSVHTLTLLNKVRLTRA